MLALLRTSPLLRLLLWLLILNVSIFLALYIKTPEEYVLAGPLINLLFISAFVVHHYVATKIKPKGLSLYLLRLVLTFSVLIIFGGVIVPVLEAADVPIIENVVDSGLRLELPSIWYDMDFSA
jgi:hypothetical protein